MFRAGRVVDLEPAAQRVEVGLGAGKPSPCDGHRVDRALPRQRREAEPPDLGIHEPHVEVGVMDDEGVVADEFQEIAHHFGEYRMAGQEFGRQAMNGEGLGRHVALGIDVSVEVTAGRQMVDQLDTADLDDAMTGRRIEARRFRIKDDFAHAPAAAFGRGGHLPPRQPRSMVTIRAS